MSLRRQHSGSKICGSRFQAREAKVEEVTSKLAQVYAVNLSVCRSNGLLQEEEEKEEEQEEEEEEGEGNFSDGVNFAKRIQNVYLHVKSVKIQLWSLSRIQK